MHPVDKTPEPGVDIPQSFSTHRDVFERRDRAAPDVAKTRRRPEPVAVFDPSRDSFADDATLTQLTVAALGGNFTIAQAQARLTQARTGIGTAASSLLPTVTVNATSTKTFPDNAQNIRVEAASGSGVLDIDLFGETLSALSAARHDSRAAAFNLSNAKLQVSHDIAAAYFDAAEARENLALVDFQIEIASELADIIEFRFGQGVSSLSDVLQQQEQSASLAAQRPTLVSNLRLAENRLDALIGMVPDGADRTQIAQLELPRGDLALGAPASLLDRRPDLAAAKATLVAADYRVAQAVADFFPDVSISGMLAVPDLAFASTMIWTAVGRATQTLFNGGRRVATVIRQGAAVDEQAAVYAQSWIDAIAEVENISWQERNQRDLVARLEEQVELGNAALAASRNRYMQGDINYVTVLAALQSVQATERSLVQAKRQMIGFRLGLLRALGLTPTGIAVLQPEDMIRLSPEEDANNESH